MEIGEGEKGFRFLQPKKRKGKKQNQFWNLGGAGLSVKVLDLFCWAFSVSSNGLIFVMQFY